MAPFPVAQSTLAAFQMGSECPQALASGLAGEPSGTTPAAASPRQTSGQTCFPKPACEDFPQNVGCWDQPQERASGPMTVSPSSLKTTHVGSLRPPLPWQPLEASLVAALGASAGAGLAQVGSLRKRHCGTHSAGPGPWLHAWGAAGRLTLGLGATLPEQIFSIHRTPLSSIFSPRTTDAGSGSGKAFSPPRSTGHGEVGVWVCFPNSPGDLRPAPFCWEPGTPLLPGGHQAKLSRPLENQMEMPPANHTAKKPGQAMEEEGRAPSPWSASSLEGLA